MTGLHRALLRSASWLVPAAQRPDWLAEWAAELCYVTHRPTPFCLGAFRDAFWCRRNRPFAIPRSFAVQSPFRCLLLLATLASLSVFFAVRLPSARDVLLPLPYRDARTLAMISAPAHAPADFPSVSLDRYRALSRLAPPAIAAVAFYRPIESRALTVAFASANLFDILAIPVPPAGPSTVVLSDAAWRTFFASDPRIVGRTVEIAGQPAIVAAVIPAASWRLPGRIDAWLLQDPSRLAQLQPHTAGFVVARLRAPAAFRWNFALPNEQGAFASSSLDSGPMLFPSLLMIAIAALVLSATSRLALGDYPANRHFRFRRWLFLAAKLALLAPLVVCGSLDVAALIGTGAQAHGLLLSTFFALHWALQDQRQRCPACLRTLTNPTRIGGPSQIFLEWYGTELICAQGHGLLYVPEIPTSSYDTQRWQYLDPSWSSLF